MHVLGPDALAVDILQSGQDLLQGQRLLLAANKRRLWQLQ